MTVSAPRNNGIWMNRKRPSNDARRVKRLRFDDDDSFIHPHGKVKVISVDQKIISKHEELDDGSKVLTGFVDIEKLIRVEDECGECRVIFLEKILPFQILELELEREQCHEE